MTRYEMKKVLGEACLLVALLVSIGFGAVVGFFWGKYEQGEDGVMKTRVDAWVFSVMIIAIIVAQRMVDQVAGIHVLTSYTIPVAADIAIDTAGYPRAVYVLAEMGSALLAVCIMEIQLRKMRADKFALVWVLSMIGGMHALGMLGLHPGVMFLAVGVIALIGGLREYGERLTTTWIELEKGLMAGCLLGGSLRYGFTFGILAIIVGWIVQDRCLWIGTLIGALFDRRNGKL